MDAKNLVSQFESLGDNCEFGVVQRHVGAEPLGFFRWSWTPLRALLEVLDGEFENVDPERIEIYTGLNSELMVRVQPWGFQYHTHQIDGSIELARLREQQIKVIAFLKRKILDDLASGTKTFIRKGSGSRGLDQALELHRRLERFGPNTLLWVVPEGDRRNAGTVEVLQPGLLKGYIDRLAPPEDAYDASPLWLDICRHALDLRQVRRPPGTVAGQPRGRSVNLLRSIHVDGNAGWWSTPRIETRALAEQAPVEARVPVSEHRLLSATCPESGVVCGYTVRGGLADAAVHTASCYVRIAGRAAVRGVGAVLRGIPPLAQVDADPAIRDRWQRVWVAGRIAGGEEPLTVGLSVVGDADASIWASCWQLELGAMPTPYVPSWSGRMQSGGHTDMTSAQALRTGITGANGIACTTAAGKGRGWGSSMDLRQLFQNFEGLGNNCEFGIVQNAVGHIAPSLFKNCGFNTTEQIINAVDAGFEGMFEEGAYSFTKPDLWPEYALACHRYGILFHTGLPSDHPDPQEEFRKRIASFRYMKEKLLSDLKEGSKAFVYRHNAEFSDDLAERLLAAIRRHGPGTLLYVREDRRPERRFAWVERTGRAGLLYGGIPHLSNENPPEINFAAWEKICLGALHLTGCSAGEAADTNAGGAETGPPCPYPEPPPGASGVIEHRVFDQGPFFCVVVGAEPLETYTASASLWIPGTFSGSSINLVMLGFPTERFVGCDLTRRDCWQRVSVTARVPAGMDRIAPAMVALPDSRGALYTTDWNIGRELAAPATTSGENLVAKLGERAGPLGYRFNNGGLNNQKMALFGLFAEAKLSGAEIFLPDLCLFDQGEDMARKGGLSVPPRHTSLSTHYAIAPLQEFARRHGIRIAEAPQDREPGGWEFFEQGAVTIGREQAGGALSADGFVCEFFRHLVCRAGDSEELGSILEGVASRGIRAVVQCRVEKDWELYAGATLNELARGEDHSPGFMGIMRKVRNTLPDESVRGGILVACDEAWLPEPKEGLRGAVARETGLKLFWKSDFLPPEAMSMPPLFLSMLDFEASVRADVFVGLSRSTFSNLATVERFARTRHPAATSYIYNRPGPLLARRTDNGAYHWAEGASNSADA